MGFITHALSRIWNVQHSCDPQTIRRLMSPPKVDIPCLLLGSTKDGHEVGIRVTSEPRVPVPGTESHVADKVSRAR